MGRSKFTTAIQLIFSKNKLWITLWIKLWITFFIKFKKHIFNTLQNKKAAQKNSFIYLNCKAINRKPATIIQRLFPLNITTHARSLDFFLRFAQQKVFKSNNQIFTRYIFVISRSRIIHLPSVDKV